MKFGVALSVVALSSATGVCAEPPMRAAAFIDTLGVNAHLTQQAAYADRAKVMAALAYLGVKHLRDAAPDPRKPFPKVLAAYADAGFDFSLFGSGYGTARQAVAQAAIFQSEHPGAIVAFEGFNEPNNWKRPSSGWYAQAQDTHSGAATYTHELKIFEAALPSISAIPVINPSDEPPPGRIGDVVNVHSYGRFSRSQRKPQIGYPQPTLWYDLRRYRAAAPGLPTWVTETGYFTSKGVDGVSENVQAEYLLETLVYNAQHAVSRTYLYELLDQREDNDSEHHYGLFRTDFSPKPAATRLRNLLKSLKDSGQPSIQPNNSLVITFDDPDVKQLLLAKANGDYVLLFWKEQNLWDGQAATPVIPSPTTLNWTLNAARDVSVLDLGDGSVQPEGRARVSGRFSYDYGVRALSIAAPSGSREP